ncbi:tyrosine-type recombinase/integrase [Nibricoccus sp. IMCC34717]|uniref:tyrosine-type recombinase/integrase n=1 Tax=Nibricoccus sp. IMCC34717 TaxID=3034021 RepID=UPI00384DA1F1
MSDWDKPRDFCLHVTQKRVADEKRTQMVREFELEAVGLGTPRAIREGLKLPILDQLDAFLAYIEGNGRTWNTIHAYRVCIRSFVMRTGLDALGDFNEQAFIRWVSVTNPSAKYRNDMLGYLRTFTRWLVKRSLLAVDPFAHVEKATVRDGYSKRSALTLEQIQRLLSCVPQRRATVYLVAIYTGLRRAELNQLRWGDFDLDSGSPSVLVRGSISKNARTERLPLHPDAVEALKAYRPEMAQPFEWVFAGRVPNMDTFHRDRERAGIPRHDALGGKVDFHSLRTTTATLLSAHGVAPRVAMQLMRHSEIRLTMRTYTNPSGLPLAEGVAKIPSFSTAKTDTPHNTPERVLSGHFLSSPGAA